jgi:hypothetical protein
LRFLAYSGRLAAGVRRLAIRVFVADDKGKRLTGEETGREHGG